MFCCVGEYLVFVWVVRYWFGWVPLGLDDWLIWINKASADHDYLYSTVWAV